MRTSVSIPEPLFAEVCELAGERSLREFVLEALDRRIQELKRERLEMRMAVGYETEAEEPSLDAEWHVTETEGA
jgi:metal-responsive CopG/Arc/MetJ family transcriptional regulator